MAANIDEANATGQSIIEEAYENHRVRNNTQSVPLAEFGDVKPMSVNYGKLSTETATAFNETIAQLATDYDTPLTNIRTMTKQEAFGRETVFATTTHDYTSDTATLIINPIKCKDADTLRVRIVELSEDGYCVKIDPAKALEYVPTHEFAHTVLNMEDTLSDKTNWVGANYEAVRAARAEIEPIYERYMAEVEKLTKKAKELELQALTAESVEEMDRLGQIAIEAMDAVDAVKLSEYSLTDIDEFLAEAFTNERIGVNSNSYAQEVMTVINKYFGRL